MIEVDEYSDSQGADEPESESVDIRGLVDLEVEAKVEILAFMTSQGYRPADARAASG